MTSLRWSAIPATLIAVITVLVALRLDIVMNRSKGWQGNGCIIGPYDPSEHIYLWSITIAAGVTLVAIALITLLAKTIRLRVAMAILSVPVLLLSTGYLLFAWTGGETSNRPGAASECSFG